MHVTSLTAERLRFPSKVTEGPVWKRKRNRETGSGRNAHLTDSVKPDSSINSSYATPGVTKRGTQHFLPSQSLGRCDALRKSISVSGSCSCGASRAIDNQLRGEKAEQPGVAQGIPEVVHYWGPESLVPKRLGMNKGGGGQRDKS